MAPWDPQLICPTCGAPVDYLDEKVIRHGHDKGVTRSYHFTPPPPVDVREVRLEAVERFVRLVDLKVGDMQDYQAAVQDVLETMRQQVRGQHGS